MRVPARFTKEEHIEKMLNSIPFRDSKEKYEFKEWIDTKFEYGGRFFDTTKYYRCFITAKRLQQDQDSFTVFCGKEGCGKSTHAIQWCTTISPTFCLDHICYELNDFIKAVKIVKKGDSILLDEGGMFLFSREAMSTTNRLVTKLFTVIRQMNIHICICMPLFHTLDSYIRDHRINNMIHISHRGRSRLHIDLAIKRISERGRREKRVRGIPLPNGHYSDGYFANRFPEINDINEESYKHLKRLHFLKFVDELESKLDEEVTRDQMKDYILFNKTDIDKKTKYHPNFVSELIESGKLDGKIIDNTYFIHKKDIERLRNGEFSLF